MQLTECVCVCVCVSTVHGCAYAYDHSASLEQTLAEPVTVFFHSWMLLQNGLWLEYFVVVVQHCDLHVPPTFEMACKTIGVPGELIQVNPTTDLQLTHPVILLSA